MESLEDIQRDIKKTPKPNIIPDMIIDVGACGFSAPILRSYETLWSMEPGKVLRTESRSPCSYPDMHAWVKRNKKVEFLGVDIEGDTLVYYLRRAE